MIRFSPFRWGTLFWAVAFLMMSGCSKQSRSTTQVMMRPTLDPGPLLRADTAKTEFVWRQRVTARWDTQRQSFDAVLQLRGGTLSLIGLAPMGPPGFVVSLSSEGLDFQNRSDRRLPFPPEYIIADVQRAFFPWLAPPSEDEFTGTQQGHYDVLAIGETFVRGVMRERTFTRSDAPARGTLRVVYQDWRRGEDTARRVLLTNDWFGYTLEIITVDQQRLPPQK